MSDATGLGVLDIAILEACERAGAGSGAPYLKTQRVLDVLEDSTGIGPRHAYEPLCDMARQWVIHLPLIDFHGNSGTPDFGPASPRYTECRLTPLGSGVLAAERRSIGPLPVGLINGNTHTGGTRPPLDPTKVLHAIRAASTTIDDDPFAAIVGLPAFATGCAVNGDRNAFAAGSATELQLAAHLVQIAPDQLLIAHLPPDCSPTDIANRIQSRVNMANRPLRSAGDRAPAHQRRADLCPIRDVNDKSTSRAGTQLVITVAPDSSLAAARAFLDDTWGIKRTLAVQLQRPLAELIRGFAEPPTADLTDRLTLIESALTT